MMWWRCLFVVVVVGVGVGCTSPNPRSCHDGVCSDQSLPFCDVDGALAGAPNTCIAVACTPQEFVTCRGDLAITCNTAGTDYDLLQCPHGCSDANGGCVECMSDQECTNPAPICDGEASRCRSCRTDDECPSSVCEIETGSCVLDTAIVYASPDGSIVGACTQAEPCALSRAVDKVTTSALGRTLRLMPGTYAAPFEYQGRATIKAVATGAELGKTSGLTIGGGAALEIRGIAIRSSTLTGDGGKNVVCGDVTVTNPKSSLTVRDSILAGQSPSLALQAFRCNLRIERSELGPGPGLQLGDDTTFEGDRLYIRAPADYPGYHGAFGKRVAVRLTNSIIEDVSLSYSTSDTTTPGSTFSYAFNTFIFTASGMEQYCEVSASGAVRDIRFENNIFLSTPSTDLPNAVRGAGCTFSNNILFPQSNALVNNLIADPQLVDVAAKDYRLKPSSPAIDAAIPSTGLGTDHDFAGTARPQGSAPDIGAFERLP